MRGIYLRKLFISLIACASVLVLALSSTSSFAATRDEDTFANDDTSLTYICEEGVWYKIVPNEKIRAEFADDETHVVDFVIQVSGEDGKAVVELCFSDESSFDIAQICSDTHEDILNYRGAYMMECDGTLYFAVCVFDVNGDAQTYLWRENDVKTVCIAGDLEKTDGVVSVREALSSGVEKVTTMNQEKWIQQSEISFDGAASFTLSRPLLVAAEINLDSSTEMLIFPAGSDVTITDFLEHDGYGWYYVEAGDDSGWMPVENRHLVLQNADFYDTFALPGSEIICRDTLNESWLWVDVDMQAITFEVETSGTVSLNEIFPELSYFFGDVNTQIYLTCPDTGLISVGIVYFDEALADTFIAVQFPMWMGTSEDGEEQGYMVYSIIYRIVGCWAVPLYSNTTNPMFSEKLLDIDYSLYFDGVEYNENPEQILKGHGTVEINGQMYELEGLNQLVPVTE